jgi:hypothetical protein
MRKPGIIIMPGVKSSLGSKHRFIEDLRNGSLDGFLHTIRDITTNNGVNFSYEIVA